MSQRSVVMAMMMALCATAVAEEPVDAAELVTEMAAAIDVAEKLREEAREPSVTQCIDNHLVPMRALLEIATRAQTASVSAESVGQAELESRKVMVAASRQDALMLQVKQCVSAEVVVVLECADCPEEEPAEAGEDADTIVSSIGVDATPGSPFE